MKKIISVINAAALALALCACGKTDGNSKSSPEIGTGDIESYSPNSNSTSDPNESKVLTEQNAPVNENSTQSTPTEDKKLTLLYTENHSPMRIGCGTESGYYSIQSNVTEENRCITYVDYATKQEVVLCSDSSCKHDSERCTAILSNYDSQFCEIFFYKNHLYYLNIDNDDEGAISAGWTFPKGEDYSNAIYMANQQLYRMNPDGTNRELVYTFGENEKVEHFAVGDGDCIWFITKEPTIERYEKTGAVRYGSKNRAAVRLDLNERKIVEQIPISFKDNIDKQFIGVCGSRMIFGGIAYPDGKSAFDYMDILTPSPIVGDTSDTDEYLEFMSRCEYAFFMLDVNDKTMRQIYRTGFDEISLDYTQIGEQLYIPARNDTASAFVLDLNTGKTEEFPVPEGYKLDGFVGERPLYITTDGGYRRYIADPDTGEMKNWIFDTGTYNIIATRSDSVLVIFKTVGEPTPDGGLLNPYDLLALISLDDLYNGRKNFEPVNMLERKMRT